MYVRHMLDSVGCGFESDLVMFLLQSSPAAAVTVEELTGATQSWLSGRQHASLPSMTKNPM